MKKEITYNKRPPKYDEKIPPCFIVGEPPNDFLLPLYDGDDSRWYSVKEILDNFESLMWLIKKITGAMRESKFDPQTCITLLDHYYGGDWADWDIFPSHLHNYYYIMATPELRAVELTLEMLQTQENMNILEFRQKADALKLELWQLLPDFYKGHKKPMPQPPGYHPDVPYPFLCVEDNFIEYTFYERFGSDDEVIKCLPLDSSSVSAITVTGSDTWATIATPADSINIDLRTYDAPYEKLLHFAEKLISNNDPNCFSYDEEGPSVDFYADHTDDPRHVKLCILGRWHEHRRLLTGIFDRLQLARELIKICDTLYIVNGESGDADIPAIKHKLNKLRGALKNYTTR